MINKLSFVIPCYRSEGLVGTVIEQIRENVDGRCEYEIIAVNDCSPDNVLQELLEYASKDSNITVIDLAKNMGKHAAVMAGYSKVTGDIIVNLDDDGQCPLNRLWDLLKPLEEGYDITIAKYTYKKQSFVKNLGSSVNALMARTMIGKPKDLMLSNFSALKRFICEEIKRYHNPYPYLDGLFLRSTGRIKNVEMDENERISGSTGFTLAKSLSLWMNGFTAFSVKPLRLATFVGFIFAALGFLYALYVICRKIIVPSIAVGYSSIMAVMLFVGGVIMVLLGIIGEYIGRIYISINNSPQYVIRSEYNRKTSDKNHEKAEVNV